MAKFKINNPNLSADDVLSVMARRFEPQYEVYSTRMFGADFVIKKSGLVGLGVRVKNENDSTVITTIPFTPSVLAKLAVSGHQWLWRLFLRKKWDALEYEVQSFSAKERYLNKEPSQ